MGKIIQNGFQFVEYANSRLIRKIDDVLELKHELISLSETKTHLELSDYGLRLAEHLLELSRLEKTEIIDSCFQVIKKWQIKEAKVKDALDVAGQLNDLARDEKDSIKAKALRGLGQISAIPHVRWHALVASEYAVVIINLKYPNDMDKVREEREFQIKLMKQSLN